MKLLVILFAVFTSALHAEEKNLFLNLQLHRDFHREIITSTTEFFQLDKRGSTFFFADFDFGAKGQQLSYFEIARSFRVVRIKPGSLNLSFQYNDGVMSGDGFDDSGAQLKLIPRTWLAGATISEIQWQGASLEAQALLRQEFAADMGWQLTGVWYYPIPRTPLEFQGYVDWNSNETGDQPTSVQAEPQLQWRVRQFAIGSELEISRNFSGAYTEQNGFSYRTWYAHPTIYLRVDF